MNYKIFDKKNKTDFLKKKLVLFGAGVVAKKFLANFDKKKIAFLVDNNKSLWNTNFENFEIKSPNYLFKIAKKKKLQVIICSTSIKEISNQIRSFNKTIEILIDPFLENYIKQRELEDFECEILFTSGMPTSKALLGGGGLYKISLKNNKTNISKIISCNAHGLIKYKNGYAISNSISGLSILDYKFKIIKHYDFKVKSRIHGIAFSEKYKRFYLGCSLKDQILILDNNLKAIDEINISKKFFNSKIAQHHINDLFIKDESLYVSMFSYTGNHRNSIYDGCVVEYDLITGEEIGKIYNNLYMPHSIKNFKDSFCCIDSGRGNLYQGSSIIGKFNGFLRGLDFHGKYFFIGHSKNRNFTLKNQSLRSLDSSILILDAQNKIYRSVGIPNYISEIHEVLVIKQ